MCKMNKWQYLPRDLWFLKWKALGASSPLADFGRLRQTSDVFGRLPTSSGIFGNDRVVFKNPSTSRIKISHLYLRKSWQVYVIAHPLDKLWMLPYGLSTEPAKQSSFWNKDDFALCMLTLCSVLSGDSMVLYQIIFNPGLYLTENDRTSSWYSHLLKRLELTLDVTCLAPIVD